VGKVILIRSLERRKVTHEGGPFALGQCKDGEGRRCQRGLAELHHGIFKDKKKVGRCSFVNERKSQIKG